MHNAIKISYLFLHKYNLFIIYNFEIFRDKSIFKIAQITITTSYFLEWSHNSFIRPVTICVCIQSVVKDPTATLLAAYVSDPEHEIYFNLLDIINSTNNKMVENTL